MFLYVLKLTGEKYYIGRATDFKEKINEDFKNPEHNALKKYPPIYPIEVIELNVKNKSDVNILARKLQVIYQSLHGVSNVYYSGVSSLSKFHKVYNKLLPNEFMKLIEVDEEDFMDPLNSFFVDKSLLMSGYVSSFKEEKGAYERKKSVLTQHEENIEAKLNSPNEEKKIYSILIQDAYGKDNMENDNPNLYGLTRKYANAFQKQKEYLESLIDDYEFKNYEYYDFSMLEVTLKDKDKKKIYKIDCRKSDKKESLEQSMVEKTIYVPGQTYDDIKSIKIVSQFAAPIVYLSGSLVKRAMVQYLKDFKKELKKKI